MRLPVLAAVLLMAAPATASDWRYEDDGVPVAYVDNGAAQFQFACRGGDLAMGFWVRVPHRQVAEAASINVAILPDPSGAGVTPGAGANFAQEMPLIHHDGIAMVIVRGPVAAGWARIAQRAARTIRLAYVRAGGTAEVLDSIDFGAGGSAVAIRKVLDRCG